MNKLLIQDLISRFIKSYDSAARENIWQKQSAAFRQFWSQRVLAQGLGKISDDDCDAIIRILDRNGKGNTKDSHAVARALVPQNVWRNLFNILHSDQKLGNQVDSILRERNIDCKIKLVDDLYAANAGGKNWLTGESGNVLNIFLAAYDPLENLLSASLKHRKAQLDFLEAKLPFDWSSASVGSRIVHSNLLIREDACALGLENSALTISAFLYFEPVFELWHSQDTVKRTDKKVIVTVPQNSESEKTGPEDENELRESLQVQATLAEIGSQMGFQIWLPRADRGRVLTQWKPEPGVLLDNLPVGFDPATMKTIEQIDVLWLKRRSVVRAFEIEHTTSVYSGILRMADLLAMQPNLKIRLHIVAPASRREKVFQEIRRPVFALLEGGALSETCTYLSYDTVADLRGQQHLGHLSDKVLEDYEEKVQDAD